MNTISFLMVLCSNLVILPSIGQSAMGGWTFHVSTREVIDVAAINDYVYAAYKNGIVEYDLESNEKTMLNSVNGLTDIGITALGTEPKNGLLIVGYGNGNIDKIEGTKTTNIPAIRLAQIQGSKVINKIISHNGFVYIATGFGIVKLDPLKNEVRETYFPNSNNDNILDICIKSDTLYALTKNVLRKGGINNPVLSDPGQWITQSNVPVSSEGYYTEITNAGGNLILAKVHPDYGKDSVFIVQNSGLQCISDVGFEIELKALTLHGSQLALNLFDGLLVYKSSLDAFDYGFNNYNANNTFSPNASIRYQDFVFIGDANYGLIKAVVNSGFTNIDVVGPPKSDFYRLDFNNNNLLVAGGGLSGISPRSSSAGVYRYTKNEWSLLDDKNTTGWTDSSGFLDAVSVAYHPTKDEFAVGTYSAVPLTLINDQNQVTSIFKPENSPLEKTALNNGWTYISDMLYDDLGNLWMTNSYAINSILKCYDNQGVWHSLDLGSSTKTAHTSRMVQDYNGNIWISMIGRGMVGFNYNKTLDDVSDDKVKIFNTGENTGALPANNVTALAVDFDNEIWVGTESGFGILYNSAGSFDATPGEYNIQRIKLEFEGNVEYLLGSTYISSIVVDGGNRKWIGTGGSGIFCLSPDGLTILKNFTTENSPLISNNISDMKIDQTTGEMYIITDAGLISHRIDASYEDPDYSDVKVFPNPVDPDFAGVITIQGIRYDSDVKVTDAAGNLVYKTTSNGGTATWNGRNLNGEKVRSGIYLIWTSPNEGKGRKVGKVAIINRQ